MVDGNTRALLLGRSATNLGITAKEFSYLYWIVDRPGKILGRLSNWGLGCWLVNGLPPPFRRWLRAFPDLLIALYQKARRFRTRTVNTVQFIERTL